jgi:hypothetical protein
MPGALQKNVEGRLKFFRYPPGTPKMCEDCGKTRSGGIMVLDHTVEIIPTKVEKWDEHVKKCREDGVCEFCGESGCVDAECEIDFG